jgi:hypothetical protein
MYKQQYPWQFWATVIRDGDRYGLLLKRRDAEHGIIECAYFYRSDHTGLAPGAQILKLLRDPARQTKAIAIHGKNVAQVLVFDLLCACAEAARKRPSATQLPLADVKQALWGTKGRAPIAADRLTTRIRELWDVAPSSDEYCLRNFLGGVDSFRKAVLWKVDAADEIVLHAAFGVIDFSELCSDADLIYLKSARSVLRADADVPARWFRREGPLAKDFTKGMVADQGRWLQQLDDQVHRNALSLLIGPAASGKTVLVRALMMLRIDAGEANIFHFDYGQYDSFEPEPLLHEIHAVNGLVVIENIHLERHLTRLVQGLRPIAKESATRSPLAILMTGCSTNVAQTEVLADVPVLELPSFEHADNIIGQYLGQHPGLPQPDKVRSALKHAAGRNYWFLSYALEGLRHGGLPSDPTGLVESGVKSELQALGRRDPRIPKVLVALSPLAMVELHTEEAYLRRRFGFDEAVLTELVDRGLVTELVLADDRRLFGLPHQSIAKAYWRFGTRYRDLLDCGEASDFICDYACSSTTNGLVAARRSRVTNRLAAEGKLLTAIRADRTVDGIGAVDGWNVGATPTGLASILAERIVCQYSLPLVGYLLWRIKSDNATLASLVEESVDWRALAARLVAEPLPDVARMFAHTGLGAMLGPVWDRLDVAALADRCCGSATEFLAMLYTLSICDSCRCERFLRAASTERLKTRLIEWDKADAVEAVDVICRSDHETGARLLDALDPQGIFDMVAGVENPVSVRCLLTGMRQVSPEKARAAADLLVDISETQLGLWIRQPLGLVELASYMSILGSTAGRALFQRCEAARIGESLVREGDAGRIGSCLRVLRLVDKRFARDLLRGISEAALQELCQKQRSAAGAFACVAEVMAIQKTLGRSLLKAVYLEMTGNDLTLCLDKVRESDLCDARVAMKTLWLEDRAAAERLMGHCAGDSPKKWLAEVAAKKMRCHDNADWAFTQERMPSVPSWINVGEYCRAFPHSRFRSCSTCKLNGLEGGPVRGRWVSVAAMPLYDTSPWSE